MSGNDLPSFATAGDCFEAARRAALAAQLKASHVERLRDLEAMWDFNERVWARNPEILRIAERLWKLQGR
jgi:hypothetical protein